MVNSAGEYAFDPARLGECHAICLRTFVELVRSPGNLPVVVDNTNTTIAEIAPYAALALAYGHDLEIVLLQASPGIAAARNIHGVPESTVRQMATRAGATYWRLPPWWPKSIVTMD
jgi:hypothetical protein